MFNSNLKMNIEILLESLYFSRWRISCSIIFIIFCKGKLIFFFKYQHVLAILSNNILNCFLL